MLNAVLSEGIKDLLKVLAVLIHPLSISIVEHATLLRMIEDSFPVEIEVVFAHQVEDFFSKYFLALLVFA